MVRKGKSGSYGWTNTLVFTGDSVHVWLRMLNYRRVRRVLYLQQDPEGCPQSWNRQGAQPLQPASDRLLSDDAWSREDRALVIAASKTTVPRSDRAAQETKKKHTRSQRCFQQLNKCCPNQDNFINVYITSFVNCFCQYTQLYNELLSAKLRVFCLC